MPSKITLKASALHALVKPVLPFAATGLDLPALCAVLIEANGDYLTATATDRYRVGIKRIKPDGLPPTGFRLLIDTRDVQQILRLFKPSRQDDQQVTITADDAGKFTVASVGGLFDGFTEARLVFRCVEGEYPDVRKIVATALATEPNLTAPMAFNVSRLSDFRHAVHGAEPIRLWGADPNKPVAVAIGDDFVGAIMPVRAGDGRHDAVSWGHLLTEAPKPKPRAKRAVKSVAA